jgi:hypothetical protein
MEGRMSISAGQAAAALQEIERTELRTRVSGGYQAASPHLILWGCVWAVGYAGCGLAPPAKWGLVWLPLILLGTLGSAWFGRRAGMARTDASHGAGGWRSVAMAGTIALFMGSTFFVFRVTNPLPYLVFPALVTGLVYTLAGLLAPLPRFAWIGATIFVVTLGGYVAAPALTPYWIAIAGGGGLMLGGLWLRHV